MSTLLRYLTRPGGSSTAQLAEQSGWSVLQVRAELLALEAAGKACRQRGAVGRPHLWWRTGAQPLQSLDVLLVMVLAARMHKGAQRVRGIFARLAQRAADPALQQILDLARRGHDPHAVAELALQHYAKAHDCG